LYKIGVPGYLQCIAYSTDSFHQAFGEVMQAYIAGTLDKDAACAEIEVKWVELEGEQN